MQDVRFLALWNQWNHMTIFGLRKKALELDIFLTYFVIRNKQLEFVIQLKHV